MHFIIILKVSNMTAHYRRVTQLISEICEGLKLQLEELRREWT